MQTKPIEHTTPPTDTTDVRCDHCGLHCGQIVSNEAGQRFCCQGCAMVYELLHDHGMDHFYKLNNRPGVSLRGKSKKEDFSYLNDPRIADKLIQYRDATQVRIQLTVPGMYCSSCIWILENLHRLLPAIIDSRVHFMRRSIQIRFEADKTSIAEVVTLLDHIGYSPELSSALLETDKVKKRKDPLIAQIGVAGFCFGNIMLFALPEYLAQEPLSKQIELFLRYANLVLALPVLLFSAQSFYSNVWHCMKKRVMHLDVPIVMGISALGCWSFYEVLSGHGPGYFDSLAGLVFFLLLGKYFRRVRRSISHGNLGKRNNLNL